jgi:hypothetical protein
MNTLRTIVALGLLVAVTGCTPSAREVGGAEVLANLTSNPLDCMVYRGSDSTYYYFDRAQFKTKKRFKVRREEVVLPANAKMGDIPTGMRLSAPATRPAR